VDRELVELGDVDPLGGLGLGAVFVQLAALGTSVEADRELLADLTVGPSRR
jgi:hypothetical protein